ncbi:MAG TPA: DUF6600 domain-containing protein [Bacteroidia bacterium]|jgi:hypothetical protein|nr:DUF6600 domain-containing protein [Bacteroidia bacterium]
MNSSSKLSRFILILTISLCTVVLPAQRASVSFQVFYNELSPYGTWIDYPSYGYVWTPYAGADFIPYSTAGHWVWTDEGWLWLSDYAWGWGPFHYGRWLYDDYYGWLWIPGNDWGPAWVCWRSAPGFYGWVALGPVSGIDIFWGYNYYGPRQNWVYLPARYIADPNPSRYYGPRGDNSTFLKNSTVISRTSAGTTSHTRYISGPDRASVEKASGTTLTPVHLSERTTPGHTLQNNNLSLYRPSVNRNAADKPAPSHISNRNAIKPVSERTTASFFKQPVAEPEKAKTSKAPPERNNEKNNASLNHKGSTPTPTAPKRPEGPFEHPSASPAPHREAPMHEHIPPPLPPRHEFAPVVVPHNRPPGGGGRHG